MKNPLVWIGLAGTAPDDNARAKHWEDRLHWAMVAVALLAVPSYLLDTSDQFPQLHPFAVVLDGFIFVAFAAEAAWMMHVSSHPLRYLADNWLNIAILAGSAASMLGASTEWVPLVRLARVAVVGLVVLRTFGQFEVLFTRQGAPKLVGVTMLLLALSGAALYWLEPTVATYWDGVWLAFATATTIGYGDLVATTAGARLVSVFVSLIGFAIIAVFTANVVAFFVRRDAPGGQVDLREDIRRLREDVARLLQDGERARSESSLGELEALRGEVAQLSSRLATLCAQLDATKAPPTAVRR